MLGVAPTQRVSLLLFKNFVVDIVANNRRNHTRAKSQKGHQHTGFTSSQRGNSSTAILSQKKILANFFKPLIFKFFCDNISANKKTCYKSATTSILKTAINRLGSAVSLLHLLKENSVDNSGSLQDVTN